MSLTNQESRWSQRHGRARAQLRALLAGSLAPRKAASEGGAAADAAASLRLLRAADGADAATVCGAPDDADNPLWTYIYGDLAHGDAGFPLGGDATTTVAEAGLCCGDTLLFQVHLEI